MRLMLVSGVWRSEGEGESAEQSMPLSFHVEDASVEYVFDGHQWLKPSDSHVVPCLLMRPDGEVACHDKAAHSAETIAQASRMTILALFEASTLSLPPEATLHARILCHERNDSVLLAYWISLQAPPEANSESDG